MGQICDKRTLKTWLSGKRGEWKLFFRAQFARNDMGVRGLLEIYEGFKFSLLVST